ncbi:MAG: thioredoxin [Alphaproteobacteria bacterium]|nr:thioredoxin [Alphaproteobacteria bacterium]
MAIINATDASFDQDVLFAKGLVLVDFWASWCGPCKMIGPILEELDKELNGKAKIVKVNVDENPTPPTTFGVRSIPALMLFKDGKLLETKVGVQPKASLISWIESHS